MVTARPLSWTSGARALFEKALIFALAALAAYGCGGGGNPQLTPTPTLTPLVTPGPSPAPSSGISSTPTPSPVSSPTPTPSGSISISGTAIQGAMTGSTVTAFAVNLSDGSSGAALGSTATHADGSFTLSIAPQSGPVRLSASGGSYSSEMDGRSITAPATVSLLLAAAAADRSGVSLNPLSTFIDSRTVGMLSAGGAFGAALSAATSRIERIYGLTSDPGTLIPDYTAAGSDAANLGLIAGALVNEDQQLCPRSPGRLVTALANDIADGVFDGMASGAAVPYCGGHLPAIAGTADFQDALCGLQQFHLLSRGFIFGGTANILTANGLADLALDGTTAYPIAPPAAINQALSAAAPAAVNSFAPSSATATMVTVRYDAAAAALPNGKFFIAGGSDGSSTFLTSTELYDSASNTFLNPNPAALSAPRANETATLLPGGKVLVAGGAIDNTTWTNTTDLYNPATNTITAGPPMNEAREGATATLLPNGKVLIAGGRNTVFLNSSDLYDPAANTFLAPDPAAMTVAREDAAAALLPNGKVLIAGGRDASGTALASTEIYDPSANSFSAGPSMGTARTNARAILLPNGKVLIAGGLGNGSVVLASTELYDPAANSFTIPNSAAMKTGRYFAAATLLPNGMVLIAGGYGGVGTNPLISTELYDAASNTFSASGGPPMNAERGLAAAALLPNGKVIIAGGVSGTGSTISASSDLYTP